MGFLQSLEEALGLRTSPLTNEEETRYRDARASTAEKRKALDAMDEDYSDMEKSVDEERTDVVDALSEIDDRVLRDKDVLEFAEEEMADAPTPVLTKQTIFDDGPVDLADAVERRLTENVPQPEAQPERVVNQRKRVEKVQADRKEADQAETAELNKAYSDDYDEMQSEKLAQPLTEAEEQEASNSAAEKYMTETTSEIRDSSPDSDEVDPSIEDSPAVDSKLMDERALKLFATTHGGDYDPKSSMDKSKMEVIRAQMEKDPDLLSSDEEDFEKQRNRFALSIYRL